MKSNNPLISVIVPAYNTETYLAEAIESIYRQEYDNLEVIIVDDGSTDNTAVVAQSFSNRIRYIYQHNQGPASARNTGIKLARGEFITFLDADDLWSNNKLKIQLAYFEQNPELEVIMGRVQLMLLSESEQKTNKFEPFGQPSVGVNFGAGLYKKSVFEKLGYLDPELKQSEDVDFMMRIRENSVKMAIIEPLILYYRIHNSNITKERKINNTFFLQALKHSLRRRREQGEAPEKSLSNLQYLH